MGQCRTLDADVTIGCGDYSSCDNTIPIFGTIFFPYIFVFYCMFTQNCRTTNIAQGCLKLHEVIKLHSRGISSYKRFKGHNCSTVECNIGTNNTACLMQLSNSCNFSSVITPINYYLLCKCSVELIVLSLIL